VGGEVDVERRHGASSVLGVAAYSVVVTRGLGVGVVRLTDSVRGCSGAGMGTGVAGAGGVHALPCRGNEMRLGGPVEGEKERKGEAAGWGRLQREGTN
jgi:hypothetical protein